MISFAKKFLSIALALILLVGVFPAAAFAAGTEKITVSVIEADAIDLGLDAWDAGDHTASATIPVDKGSLLTEADVAKVLDVPYVYLRFPGRRTLTVSDTPIEQPCYVIAAPVENHEHVYGEWVIDQEATTEADGSKHRDCTLCDHVETVKIDKLAAAPEKVMINVPIYKGALAEVNKTKLVYVGEEGMPVDMVELNKFIDDPALEPAQNMVFDHWEFGNKERPGRDRVPVNEGRCLIAKYRMVDGTQPEEKPEEKPEQKPEQKPTGSIQDVTFDFVKPQFKDIKIRIAEGERIATLMAGDKLPMKSTDKQIMTGWTYEGANGAVIDNETVYNLAKHGTKFTAVWADAAIVTVKYYVNNKFDKPAYERNLPFVAVGQDYDISPEYLLKQYKNGYHNAKRLDGPYYLDGFMRYKENYEKGQRPNGTVEVITGVGGPEDGTETVLYCMVFDSGYNPNSKPDTTNPKTGDTSMIYATTAVMLISAGALAVFFMDRKRRNG